MVGPDDGRLPSGSRAGNAAAPAGGDRRTVVLGRGPFVDRAVAFDRPAVHLLPNYDELLIAFRDRTDAADPLLPEPARVAEAILAHIVVRDGLVVGG